LFGIARLAKSAEAISWGCEIATRLSRTRDDEGKVA